jgi:hypothetical protein
MFVKCVQGLFNFAETQDAFICNFVVTTKSCEGDFYQMYCDEQTRCGHNDFGQSMDIVTIAMMFYIMFGLLN